MKYTPSIATWCGAAATILLTLALHTLPAGAADGNPPALMTYQSYLADANGVPLASTAPKNYDVIFRIYNDQSAIAAGNRLWTEQQTVTVDKGYFSVLLGEGSQVGSESRPAINTLFTGTDISDRFVEMTVKGIGAGGSDSTLKPRLRLMTSPYAFVSKYAIHAANLVNSTNAAVVNVSGGYVGINKLVPNAALDVTGAAAVSGSLSAGSATVSGSLSAGSATVSGALTAGSASISGALSANTLAVTSATVSGAVTAASFTGNGTIPVGGIIMWSGATIPTGWALCDGTQGTPNLSGKFVMGKNATYPLNTAGGSSSITLAENQLPAHTHPYKDGYHIEASGYSPGGDASYDVVSSRGGSQGYDGSNTWLWYRNMTTFNNSTANSAVSIVPPYYALAFIMRVQ